MMPQRGTPLDLTMRNRKTLAPPSKSDRSIVCTWPIFTCTQSTGSVAILLSETPHQFRGLQTAGVVVFILNLVLFVLFITAIICRFVRRPSSLRKSVTNSPEAQVLAGSLWLSIATIIICMQRFGVLHAGPLAIVALRVLLGLCYYHPSV
ncbi:C4-dicarboxylate transporter/malic acid transport protein [Penicillium robsamsonii]|uniref:C4-dicarboxylate transporter/malic acid transport protein n=1 Tax=Penicillium robsamsonii TaxID=1792511 RepID=UPI00254931A5|nr:C4-dicarboxylate transporter/malic acid transport protein [Penicillium robsamsonii]KAJ5807321.1 C4-dicarboxylate transporter/malic acid transport protein [Penicillium robsamsonii]